MRSIIAIPIIIVILFSGISVKIATHYCGGYLSATKISLTGELATCGMESSEKGNSSQETINNHCCDDVLSAYSINNNYIPSSFHLKNPDLHSIDLMFLPSGSFKNQIADADISDHTRRPPGYIPLIIPELSVLCIFRI